MRKLLYVILVMFAICSIGLASVGQAAAAGFDRSRVIDDGIFGASSSMNSSQIDSFLNRYSNSCISSHSGFTTPEPTGYTHAGGFSYGSRVTAGKAIYDAAHAYGVSPKVLLATMQKEQSLVTGSAGCHYSTPNPSHTFQCNLWGSGNIPCTSACPYSGGCVTIAMGYNCPGNCEADSEGFSKQLIRAAWHLAFGKQRSEGNIDWNVQLRNFPHSGDTWDNSDDPESCYNGPMTQGTRQRCPSGGSAYYDGYTTIDGSSTHMDTGATATLYWYTPHFSGNQNFYNIYTGWFGTTYYSNLRFIQCGSYKYIVERYIRMKRLINPQAVTAWGLDDTGFASGDGGCNYPTYSAQLGGGDGAADSMVIRSRDTGVLYMVDQQNAYRLSKSTAMAWGIRGGNTAYPQFDGDSIHILNVKSSLPKLAKSSAGGKVYLLDGGKLHCVNCTGVANGGVSSSTLTIKLINGSPSGSVTTFYHTLISNISTATGGSATDTSLDIGHSFKAHAHWYYFDYGKVHMVKDSLIDRWNKYDPALPDSPQLSMDLRHSMPYAPDLRKGYKYGSSWYYIDSGGHPHRVSSSGLAKAWGVYNEPQITSLLQRSFGN